MSLTNWGSNQPRPLVPYDARTSDQALLDALSLWAKPALDGHGGARLAEIGVAAGSEQVQEWAVAANRHGPRLLPHAVPGIEIEFSPAWHALIERAVGWGLHATPWVSGEPAAHTVRAAGFYLWSQAEAGHGCPISMTYAAVPALRTTPSLAAEWVPKLASTSAACLAGMCMTEVQGGSDVRATVTSAVPSDDHYLLTGHKWFFSAPMGEVALVLAQAPGGLSCFLVPRRLPDGTPNPRRLVRLKDKLGNRSNASSEVEFSGTSGWLLGTEGRGVATIIEMVAATRLDCVLGAAAVQRRAVASALWWAQHRTAFGGPLIDKALMRNVLADLAVEQEAAMWLGLRLAHAVDLGETTFLRLALPVSKYLVCKRTPALVAEALECLGGNGYVEDSGLPLLYREAPLNSIWEGSGSVQALDVLRALQREPAALESWLLEIGAARGIDPHLDAAAEDVLTSLSDLADIEFRARRLAERMALVLQGSLLVQHAPAAVAEAFCASRLGMDGGRTFGTLPRSVNTGEILERAGTF
ncbi:acyl-CoA dehydrogenase family protein [Flindersiella endophytica]